jgi:CspA family cold shock protein
MSATGQRETGNVKWFNAAKGYGFITAAEGDELFVHWSGICAEGYKSLNEGDEVTFDVTLGKKGHQATNVEVLTANGPRAERPPAK